MSGDREERSAGETGMQKLSINDELGLMWGGEARGHGGGRKGESGWMEGEGTREWEVEGEMDRWAVQGWV